MKLRSPLVAALAAALLAPAGAATAGSVVVADPAGDLVDHGEHGSTLAPGYEIGDITGALVRHGARKVRVTIAHRDLAKVGVLTSTVLVRTGKGKAAARRITVTAGPGDYRGTVAVTNGYGRKVACPVARRISYTEETVRVAVPRRCLGNPRWVRVATGVVSTPDHYASLYTDTAGAGASLDFQEPVYSRRVYR